MSDDPAPGLLAVEVGNSRWKAGLFAEPWSAASGPVAVLRGRHADDPGPPLRAFLTEHGGPADRGPVRAVWAGVNPAGAAGLLARWPADAAPPPTELPRAALDRLVRNAAREPHRVGADRLLNALAAAALAPPGTATVAVADCGTATTVDTVRLDDGARPTFAGGAILPGVVLCAKALHAHTALLPEVAFSEGDQEPDAPADGLDTAAAIRRGVLEMQAAAVERLLGDAGAGSSTLAVLTGGAAGLLEGRLRGVAPRFEPHLTLCGLALAAAGGGR